MRLALRPPLSTLTLLVPLALTGCDGAGEKPAGAVDPAANVAATTPAAGEAPAPEPPTPGKKGYVAPHSAKQVPPLVQAASKGNLDAVKALLAEGVDPNQAHESGIAPIHISAMENMLEITRALVEAGADLGLKQAAGATPLHMACAVPDSIETVRFLLQSKADPNAKDNDGRTPLIAAATNGFTDVVEALAGAGADLNHQDKDGATALHGAILFQHESTAALLIAGGANVNPADGQKLTPLHHAARKGDRKLADLLLANGGDILAKSVEGGTPSQMAVFCEHEELAKYLQELEIKAGGTGAPPEAGQGGVPTQKPTLPQGGGGKKNKKQAQPAPKEVGGGQ